MGINAEYMGTVDPVGIIWPSSPFSPSASL